MDGEEARIRERKLRGSREQKCEKDLGPIEDKDGMGVGSDYSSFD